tara:strand:+ start:645 stop:1346 length:702 start_codon:yes stop_codon:yes gene_type:complete
MKEIIILTTNTLHHNFFINELSKKYKLTIIYERIYKSKNISHFEKKTNEFEKKVLGKNKILNLSNELKLLKTDSINENKVISYLEGKKNKLILSFGVKKISSKILNISGKYIFNFHGGDVNEYRGLDSHLWAIYNNNFRSLVVTLHKVDKDLDTGRIYAKKKLQLNHALKIHNLRYETTKICISLGDKLINKYLKNKKINLKQKHHPGKYYSKMPYFLHDQVYNNFKNKLANL